MASLGDLDCLPFDSYKGDGSLIEVAVTDDLTILIEQDDPTGEALMQSIVVVGIRDNSGSAEK
jgi:hypothetical protein